MNFAGFGRADAFDGLKISQRCAGGVFGRAQGFDEAAEGDRAYALGERELQVVEESH